MVNYRITVRDRNSETVPETNSDQQHQQQSPRRLPLHLHNSGSTTNSNRLLHSHCPKIRSFLVICSLWIASILYYQLLYYQLLTETTLFDAKGLPLPTQRKQPQQLQKGEESVEQYSPDHSISRRTTNIADNSSHLRNNANGTTDPKFLLVHVGKTGGSTVAKNIRTLCARTNAQQNLQKFKLHLRKNTNSTQPYREHPTPCLRSLDQQARNNVEMKLSTDHIVGYVHGAMLGYWWNANDDGDIELSENNAQDDVTRILTGSYTYATFATATKELPPLPKDTGLTESTAFLVTVRDPIDRIVSAFHYHHPDNHINTDLKCAHMAEKRKTMRKNNRLKLMTEVYDSFYCKCFPTVNDLAEIFLDSNHNKSDPDARDLCLKMATMVLRGRSHYSNGESDNDEEGLRKDNELDLDLLHHQRRTERVYIEHLTMNYGYYHRRTLSKQLNKEIMVIRQEHLVDDLQGLETLLGGTVKIEGEATGHMSHTYGSEKYVRSETIVRIDLLQALCCAIPTEATIYRQLIQSATNLSELHKKETLRTFEERCDLRFCPKDAP